MRVTLARLNRYLFSRCAYCGQRFYYGETVVQVRTPDREKRKWLHGERHIFHIGCINTPRMENIASLSATMFE